MAIAYNQMGGAYFVPDAPAAPQQPMPASTAALLGTQPGNIGYTDPLSGQGGSYTPNPSVNTNLYETGPYIVPGTGSSTQQNLNGTHVSGTGSISQSAYEQQQQSQLNAELQRQAEARRLGYLSTVTGQQSPHVGDQVGPAADENAARAAAFARAKEQAGATALASVRSLQDIMANAGLTGSSVEGNAIAGAVGGGAGRINDYTRTQLMTDLNRAADIADRNQVLRVTQRGQDLSLIPSLMGLITAGRGAY